jgi:hypothetical protein
VLAAGGAGIKRNRQLLLVRTDIVDIARLDDVLSE